MRLLWLTMGTVGIAGLLVTLYITYKVWTIPTKPCPVTWEIAVVKVKGKGELAQGWEPFGYNPKIGAVYVKRPVQ